MDTELKQRLLTVWQTLPAGMRSDTATVSEVADFESRFGAIPTDLKWFLLVLGGGAVGTEWLDDIRQLAESHTKVAAEQEYWKLLDCFVVGWDGAGNPMALSRSTGELVVADHNTGQRHQLAPSLQAFLVAGLFLP